MNLSETEELISKNDTTSQLVKEYKYIVKKSKLLCILWMAIIAFFDFCYSGRAYCWILYSRELGYDNNTILGIILYINYIVQGICSLFWGYVADRYQFNQIGLFLSIMSFTGVFLEVIAYYYKRFSLLVIGTLIVSVFRGLDTFGFAFLSKYLPQYDAVKFMSYTYGVEIISYTLGPIMAGVVAYFINYQSIYFISLVAYFFIVTICIYGFNKESKLINMQNNFGESMKEFNSHNIDYNKNENNNKNSNSEFEMINSKEYQFPINGLTDSYSTSDTSDTSDTNDTWEMSSNESNDSGDIVQNRRKKNRYLLYIALVMNAAIFGTESITAMFYAIYIIDKYNSTILIATYQTTIMTICMMIGFIVMPKVLLKAKTDMEKVENVLLFLWHIFLLVLLIFVWNMSTIVELYICNVIFGFGFGINGMIEENIILNTQIKSQTGLVNGMKMLFRNIFRAIGAMVLSFLWNNSYDWYANVQAIFIAISFFLCLSLIWIRICGEKTGCPM